MRQTLKALDELRAGLKDCADLEHRIAAMERDRAAFAEEATAVGAALALAADEDAAKLADAIAARVASAREARRRREEKEKALAAARDKHAAIIEALAINEKLAAAMTALFGSRLWPKSSVSSTTASVASACRRSDPRDKGHRRLGRRGARSRPPAPRSRPSTARHWNRSSATSPRGRRPTSSAHAERYAALADATKALGAVGGDDAVARIEE